MRGKLRTFGRLISGFFLLVGVFSCGGGGSSGGATQNLSSNSGSSNTSATSSGSTSDDPLISAKVIDGYIQGANVYIDFNLNLQQDEGEPSAVDNGDGDYEFPYTNGEFDAITDVSFACARNRIQIAEVPVGAIDADLGEVTEAFTMYYVPYGGSSSGLINISPFTGLFVDLVREAKDQLGVDSILLSEGCGETATSVSNAVAESINTFVQDLESKYGVTLEDLYEDYIASNNSERRAKAEKIVSFLKAAESVRAALRDHFGSDLPDGYEPFVGLSQSSSEQLFGIDTESLEFVEMSVGIGFTGLEDANGWAVSNNLQTQGLKVLQDGKIADRSCSTSQGLGVCQSYEPTYENILAQLESYLSYGGHENVSLIPNIKITSQYREEKTRTANSTECFYQAMLIYDEVTDCSGAGCPDLAEVQEQINHNIGYQYPSDCSTYETPFLFTYNDRKNIWHNRVNERGNSEEIFGVQYSLADQSNLFSDPPLVFLGNDRSKVDYSATFSSLRGMFIDTENFQSAQALLQDDEFIALSLTTYGESRVPRERVVYVIRTGDDTTNECSVSSGVESGWERSDFALGEAAKQLCFEKIRSFTFY